MSTARETVHATAVCLGERGVLITGPSGSGKSALALELMALGASLIADDRVVLSAENGGPIWAEAPDATRGLIEARGVGVLRARAARGAWIVLGVDLGVVETHRLPPERSQDILNSAVPMLHKVESAHFSSAILQYLRGGRSA